MPAKDFIPLTLAILKISDTRTDATDTTGPLLRELIEADGHKVLEKIVVPDDRYKIRAALSRWIADAKVHAIVTTGGTGVTGRDGTPEAVAPLLDKVIDGFGELFRARAYEKIGTSTMLSRALAGVANGVFIFCLPGSKGACRDGWDLIRPQLDVRTSPCNFVELMPRLLEHGPRLAAGGRPRP